MVVFLIIRLVKKVLKPLIGVAEDKILVGDDPAQISRKIRSLERQIPYARENLAMKQQEGGRRSIRKATDELIHLEDQLDMYREKLRQVQTQTTA